MATRDTQPPTLALISGDRSAGERELVHIACCGSNEEHAAAMRQFLRRATLQPVATSTTQESSPRATGEHDVDIEMVRTDQ